MINLWQKFFVIPITKTGDVNHGQSPLAFQSLPHGACGFGDAFRNPDYRVARVSAEQKPVRAVNGDGVRAHAVGRSTGEVLKGHGLVARSELSLHIVGRDLLLLCDSASGDGFRIAEIAEI